MASDWVYSEKTQKAIQKKKDQIENLKQKIRDIEHQIYILEVGESPIQVGNTIYWESGKGEKRGRVTSVMASWKGFEYRANVLGKEDRVIGYAIVGTERCPSLVSMKSE